MGGHSAGDLASQLIVNSLAKLDTGSTLPDGLSFNTSTGAISGTPTTAGTSTITVKITESTTASTKSNNKVDKSNTQKASIGASNT